MASGAEQIGDGHAGGYKHAAVRVFVARLDRQAAAESQSSRTRPRHRRRVNEADVTRAMRRLGRLRAY
ncbi:MAG TPA: hypothetical protein VG816_05610 [Solirubrobacterales bacterium]|nr:hypothetical protein [Solirubrobacterales bacterium]